MCAASGSWERPSVILLSDTSRAARPARAGDPARRAAARRAPLRLLRPVGVDHRPRPAPVARRARHMGEPRRVLPALQQHEERPHPGRDGLELRFTPRMPHGRGGSCAASIARCRSGASTSRRRRRDRDRRQARVRDNRRRALSWIESGAPPGSVISQATPCRGRLRPRAAPGGPLLSGDETNDDDPTRSARRRPIGSSTSSPP